MNISRTQPIALAATLAVLLLFTVGSSALAGPWKGRKEVRDGTPHVLNPATPAMAPETIAPTEMWRVGGDDEEDIIFGVLSSIAADEAGNIYLLDSQLSEVFVFSPDGEYLRSIGREGEGPGEFRRASDLFLTPGGEVAVMQRMPGKIVLLTTDGQPSGLLRLPESLTEGMVQFGGGGFAGDDVVLSIRQFRRGEGTFFVTSSLVRIDDAGNLTATYFKREAERNMSNLVFDEKRDADALWAADNEGRVFTNDNFDAYAINVFDSHGTRTSVIEREYEHRTRSEQEKKDNAPRMIIRRGHRRVEADSKVSDTDRDVQSLFVRGDGSLWVLSSRGANDTAAGVIATFDIYDSDGRFQRQVSIEGQGNFNDDGLHFVGDRLFVVVGLESARNAMLGGDDDPEADEDDAEAMAVICYDLGGIVEAGR